MEIINREEGKIFEHIRKYIYEICKYNLQMSDTNIDIHNPIFKTLHRIYTK
jgi:hypothetical protein